MYKMKTANYQNMIAALRKFATDTEETCQELSGACSVAYTSFSEGDDASQNIAANVYQISQRYAALGKYALQIAAAMQNELERGNEGNVWNGDGMDDF